VQSRKEVDAMMDQSRLDAFKRMTGLFSIEEAARVLGVSPWTLRAHKKRGGLKTVNVGRRVLVSLETIDLISREGLPSLRIRK
jgi:excisionase family DNA binding protein